MSIGADAISENAIAGQLASSGKDKGPPPKRTVVATSDVVAQPEPR